MKFNKLLFMPFYEADNGTGAGGNGGGADDSGAGAGGGTPEGAEKTFTQADVDRIIKERLEREKRKAEEKAEEARREAERKALEEQGKYKEMYEQLEKDLQAEKARVLETRKETLLLGAGYTQEQASRYKKFLTGETDEELATALEVLKQDIPPKANAGVDPATQGNGQRQTPPAEEPYSFGKQLYERLKKSGRLR